MKWGKACAHDMLAVFKTMLLLDPLLQNFLQLPQGGGIAQEVGQGVCVQHAGQRRRHCGHRRHVAVQVMYPCGNSC